MTILNSILAFVVAIGLLVTIHEFGHFIVARLVGVKVLRFSIGFGPPLLRWGGGDDRTEYVLAVLPLGGYVKMLDEREFDVSPAERDRAFNNKSIPRRLAIVTAGPLFNFLFAILAYWVVFMLGVPGVRPIVGDIAPGSIAATSGLQSEDRIDTVNGAATPTWGAAQIALLEAVLEPQPVRIAVENADGKRRELSLYVQDSHPLTEPGALLSGLGIKEWMPEPMPVIGEVIADSPAEHAGLEAGDRIIRSGGEQVKSIQAWVDQIKAHPGQSLELEILRQGETRNLTVVPEAVEVEDGATIGRIGAGFVYPEDLRERLFALERYGPIAALRHGTIETVEMAGLTLRVLGRMLTGDVSLKNLSGPINIADYAGKSASYGLVSFLMFLAIVSISLGVLNLLPVPVLDGGHILFLGWESLRGAPPSPLAEAIGQRLGITLLVLLMAVAFYNDVTRLFGG